MFNGFTDWHSHILPGVDDGIKTIEDSLSVLKFYEEMGFKRVWLTPHIMEDYPNTPDDLQSKFEQLQKVWTGNVEIRLAAEHMLDSLFEDRLKEGKLLPIGEDGNHLLVETSYYTPPMNMKEIMERIKAKGYYPLLAHPERYRYMEEADYRDLKRKEIKFQMNFISLVGGYGETARKKAEWLLDQDMIDVAGSDLHRLGATVEMMGQSPRKNKHLEKLIKICNNKL